MHGFVAWVCCMGMLQLYGWKRRDVIILLRGLKLKEDEITMVVDSAFAANDRLCFELLRDTLHPPPPQPEKGRSLFGALTGV